MIGKWIKIGAALLAVVAVAVAAKEFGRTDMYRLWPSRSWFAEYPMPFRATQLLMDVGVVDANGDDLLDVFTSNHNYRQDFLIADGKGGYRQSLSAWGLDQNLEFPGIEISTSEPEIANPGVYLYWKGRKTFAIRTHGIKGAGRLQGSLRTHTAVRPSEATGFTIEGPLTRQGADSKMPETVIGFASEEDGLLVLEIESPGVPMTFDLDGAVPLAMVYVGSQTVSPRTKTFELALQDRHGMAWADYNDDGRMDVFITRGAIAGTLKELPESVSSRITDELFVSQPGGQYKNLVSELGIQKSGCSARQVKWVDFDQDGLLDLFINCQERGHVEGEYPKQLYRQTANRQFVEVAAQAGLDIPDHEVIDFAWLDADNDGDLDLLTSEDTGFFLYRNQGGKFSRESIGRGRFVRADIPELKGTTAEYWFVDGKVVVADFDLDGDLDAFSASKKGNALLLNDGHGKFSVVDPGAVGLPRESVTANWIDYDNDGLPDLYSVPEGLFRQRQDHRFEPAGLLVLPSGKYMAAIVNWPDLDNDGARDVLMALLENFSQWSWWEKLWYTSEDRFKWKIASLRNIGNRNHWLQVRLVGKAGNPQAIGARVSIQTPEGQQVQEVGSNDGAFFSQGHYRLYFGLGSHARAGAVRVRWPDGQVQELKDVDGGKLLVVKQEGAARP